MVILFAEPQEYQSLFRWYAVLVYGSLATLFWVFIQSVENVLEISISISPFGCSETAVLLFSLQELTTV